MFFHANSIKKCQTTVWLYAKHHYFMPNHSKKGNLALKIHRDKPFQPGLSG